MRGRIIFTSASGNFASGGSSSGGGMVMIMGETFEAFQAVPFLEATQPALRELQPTGRWDLVEACKLPPLLSYHVPV
jgi:hypothetical protein